MRVLITGGTGMLGHKLFQRLSEGLEVYASIRGSFDEIERFRIFDRNFVIENIDLTNESDLAKAIDLVRPDVVINAAGVIKQRPMSNDVVKTLSINSILPHRLAAFGQRDGFRTIVISTDCVFSGTKGNYSEADMPDALDLYGVSKKLGEVTGPNCLTLRTSIIGRELRAGHSLIEWFLSNRGGIVKGFARAIYSGFPTIVFADIIYDLVTNFPDLSGLYHVSSDPIDKYTLLKMVNDAFKADVNIESEDTFIIDRSLDSTEFRKQTSFNPLPWKEMIELFANDSTPYASLTR